MEEQAEYKQKRKYTKRQNRAVETALDVLYEWIFKAYKESGYTQQQVSEMSGVGRSTVSRVMLGSHAVSVSNLQKICLALGIGIKHDAQ